MHVLLQKRGIFNTVIVYNTFKCDNNITLAYLNLKYKEYSTSITFFMYPFYLTYDVVNIILAHVNSRICI